MARYDLGSLRRSSVLMTFGPGAIVDFRADGAPVSAVVMGLDDWDRFNPKGLKHLQHIHEPRLEGKLKVKGFRLPPVKIEDSNNQDADFDILRANRFPNWLQCPLCDRIGHAMHWGNEPGKASRYCQYCTRGQYKAFVVPVRFVTSCEHGHLDDFPWHMHVGHKAGCENNKFLQLKSTGPGLAGLILSCTSPGCGARRSMDGVFGKNVLSYTCRGHRPWLGTDSNENCGAQVRALQRGASNIYFPVIESALSIPPWSDRLQDALGTYWHSIVATEDPAERKLFIKILARDQLGPILEELGMQVDDLADEIAKRVNRLESTGILDIRAEEYRELSEKTRSQVPDPEFEVRHENVSEDLNAYLDRLARVVRIREVRAMKGFTRIEPPGDKLDRIAAISKAKTDWLPAIEVRGEGIFISLNESSLSIWENLPPVIERAFQLQQLGKDDRLAGLPAAESTNPASPRFLLLHTLAHALIRQLSLECGYSSSSLRERLYIREGEAPMSGILIYTATPDSDGTLGGLQRQGAEGRMRRILKSAIASMQWCSSDPLCIEGLASITGSHNLAACHSCVLAPETACEMFNQYLDRAMLVGTPSIPEIGFFTHLLESE